MEGSIQKNMSDVHNMIKTDCIGYIYLPNQTVLRPVMESAKFETGRSSTSHFTWQTVQLQSRNDKSNFVKDECKKKSNDYSSNENHSSIPVILKSENGGVNDENDHVICQHCTPRIDVESTDDESISLLHGMDINAFDGSFKQLDCTACKSNYLHRRSDLSLLLSALTGHIRNKDSGVMNSLQYDYQLRMTHNGNRVEMDNFEVFTIDFLLLCRIKTNSTDIFIERAKSDDMILELLQCDWTEFNAFYYDRKAFSSKNYSSIFPKHMSLNEIYLQMKKGHRDEKAGHKNVHCRKRTITDNHCIFMDIPCHLYSPFLSAVSIARLQCVSRYLYYSLRHSVPGMKLILVKHQVASLKWMRSRERSSASKRQRDGLPVKILYGQKSGVEYTFNGRYLQKYVGGTICNSFKDDIREIGRGGICADEPGLGKTITSLSLVLQTMHANPIRTHMKSLESQENALNQSIFRSYFNGTLPQFSRKQEMVTILNRIRRLDVYAWFYNPVPKDTPEYFDIIQEPICLYDIFKKTESCDCTFEEFVHQVRLCFRNAMHYNPPSHPVHEKAFELLHVFNNIINTEFQPRIINQAKKSISSSIERGNELSIYIEKLKDVEIRRQLIQSTGTVFVVPHTLLNHWVEQIELHVDLSYLCEHRGQTPLVYRHPNDQSLRKSINESIEDGTYIPAVFVDYNQQKSSLPDASFLAKFRILIIPSTRLSNEYKQRDLVSKGEDVLDKILVSELTRVEWYRLIVDEGHTIGTSCGGSNAVRMARWIRAQSKWAMTGTPTPQMLSKSMQGLRNFLYILDFLRIYRGLELQNGGDKVWSQYIINPWGKSYVIGFIRLKRILSEIAIRHTKDELGSLSKPILLPTTYIDLSQQEIMAYNTLCFAIRSNLIITSMKGKTSGKADSLLSGGNTKFAREALRNVRLACCGGTQIQPELSQKYFDETLDLMKNIHNADSIQLKRIRDFLTRVLQLELSSCQLCGIELQTLLIMPCAHLICTECVEEGKCSVCDKAFDVDEFQLLQPGFVFQWRWNTEADKRLRESEARMATELEMSRRMSITNEVTRDPRVVISEIMQRARRSKHKCEYSQNVASGCCLICQKEHDNCDFLNSMNKCFICHREMEQCPENESKSSYLATKLSSLFKACNFNRPCESLSRSNKPFIPLKVIIFSQFRQILNVVGDRLLRRFGSSCVAEYWGSYRSKELSRFIHEDKCFILLLGKDGSHGLDLSFVSHIFFMDEILDKSLESQVISRAYRMSTSMNVKNGVVIEKLVAKNSIEEIIEDSSKSSTNHNHNDKESLSHTKLHYLLQKLRPIHKVHQRQSHNLKRSIHVRQIDEKEESSQMESQPKHSKVRFE